MRILAIDPGINGGLALLSDNGLLVESMPTLSVNGKSRIDLASFQALMVSWLPKEAVIETQQSMPNQGVSSSFRTGFNYGALIGVLHGWIIPVTEVRAAVWKKALCVPADKDAARHRAAQLFPDHSASFAKKSSDGLAEAALIAYYYQKKFLG